jgi:hypothetical protein
VSQSVEPFVFSLSIHAAISALAENRAAREVGSPRIPLRRRIEEARYAD